MTRWGISWDYIDRHWTDEQYNLMMWRAAEQSRKQQNAARGRGTGNYMTEEDALASGKFTHGNRPR